MTAVFEHLYDRTPKIETIHTQGWSVYYYCDKINNLDAVSIGPNILKFILERENSIASTKRT